MRAVPDEIKPKGRKCITCQREHRRLADRNRPNARERYLKRYEAMKADPEKLARHREYMREYKRRNPEKQAEYNRQSRERIAADPERREERRKRERERMRKRRQDPEYLAKQREWSRISWERLKRNKKRYAEFLADRRIYYRIRHNSPPVSEEEYANGYGAAIPHGMVPAVLIAPLIDEWIGEHGGRQLSNGDCMRGEAEYGAGQRELAALTGVSDRTIREIVKGERETVQFVTADRLCAVLNVPLSSLYFEGSG